MKKKAVIGIVVLLSAVLATGCGNAIPELDEQQQALVVEYATSVLLKHDKNHETKLVELTLEQEEEAVDSAAKEELQDNSGSNKEEGAENESQEEGMEDVEVIDNTQMPENVSIESFLNLDPIKITYTGYEINDFYPEQGDDLYFIMNATEGNHLLILKFTAENTSEAEANLNIAQSKTRFKIAVNGEEKNALTTMLLNDMPYYQGIVAPGESIELVLICEIAGEQTEISSLALIMKSVDDIATISLN